MEMIYGRCFIWSPALALLADEEVDHYAALSGAVRLEGPPEYRGREGWPGWPDGDTLIYPIGRLISPDIPGESS